MYLKIRFQVHDPSLCMTLDVKIETLHFERDFFVGFATTMASFPSFRRRIGSEINGPFLIYCMSKHTYTHNYALLGMLGTIPEVAFFINNQLVGTYVTVIVDHQEICRVCVGRKFSSDWGDMRNLAFIAATILNRNNCFNFNATFPF